jgi:T-complex protein 1 subunit delta
LLSISIGLHPTAIAEAFEKAADKATEILKSISIPIELSDKESLHRSASTALNSKVNKIEKKNYFKIYF